RSIKRELRPPHNSKTPGQVIHKDQPSPTTHLDLIDEYSAFVGCISPAGLLRRRNPIHRGTTLHVVFCDPFEVCPTCSPDLPNYRFLPGGTYRALGPALAPTFAARALHLVPPKTGCPF